MKILNDSIETQIKSEILSAISHKDYKLATRNISKVISELHANIPADKRISYGIVYTIKELSEYLYNSLAEMDAPLYGIASSLFKQSSDFKSKGVSLGMLSYIGLSDYRQALPYFESAAASDGWNIRELSQVFFRKLIGKHPAEMKGYLLELSKTENAYLRRFVAETLRPVQENRWFYENPDYPLSILKRMFKESSLYPRTSVGNNLSDLARHLPDLVYSLVEELVESGDNNSYWIAYRACRNLVKEDPFKVMSLLKIDKYKYKSRVHRRSEYPRNPG